MNRFPLVFALAACACVPALAFAAPQIAPPAPAANAPAKNPAIDPAALALLKKAEAAMFALKTYQAECRTTLTYDIKPGETKPRPPRYETAFLAAAKPNKMRYDQWAGRITKVQAAKQTPEFTFVSDGKTQWEQFGKNYHTNKNTAPEQLNTILEPWNGFWAKKSSPYSNVLYYQKENGLLEARKYGMALVDGVACDKVFTHIKTKYEDMTLDHKTTWFIGTKDGLVRRKSEHIGFDDANRADYNRDAILHNIRTNFVVVNPAKTFAYTPPQGVQSRSERDAAQPKLLAAGTPAPDFTAYDKDNKPVKLSDFKGRVVLLDFWASWCPPCIASMPHNQEVTQKLQAEGVPFVLLAVDDGEARPDFLKWVAKHEAEMNALIFVHSDPGKAEISGKHYNVSGIPTQYVIDADGVIRASFVGYGGPTDAMEKAVRACLPKSAP